MRRSPADLQVILPRLLKGMAEGMGLISNLLHLKPLKSLYSLGASGDFQKSL